MDHDRRDLLGDEGDDGDDGYDDGFAGDSGSVLEAVRAPEALALASVALAVISLMGLGLLNGPPYMPQSFFADQPGRSTLVASALIGAGLALLPAALGVAALRRLPDGAHARAVAGAGVLLAAVAVLLRLVLAVRTALDDSAQFVPF